MTKRALRILHVSDLHMGQERGANRWRMFDVLGDAWRDNLDDIANDGPVDLVCFTGDLAFSGKKSEYREVSTLIKELLQRLELDKSRFFCVPGNHDINRDVQVRAWRKLRDAGDMRPEDFDPWVAGGRAPRGCKDAWIKGVLQRRRSYDAWLVASGLGHMRPRRSGHGRLGYRFSFKPGEIGNVEPLHLVGFDSAWLAGGGDAREQDNANLRVTCDQVGRLLSDGDGPLKGHIIGLMHHPFSCLIESESTKMPTWMSRHGVGLLLHGHLHDMRLTWTTDPDHGLHVSIAGSQYQRNNVPNTIHLLDVEFPGSERPRPVRLWVRAWEGDGGHWYSDNKRYRGMVDGRLRLAPEEPIQDTISLDPGVFIGRKTELEQLRAALLPASGEAPKPVVVEGMAGAGKSRLVEEFLRRHWLPARGLTAETATTAQVLRLELHPDDTRDAQALGRAIADSLKLAAPDVQLWPALREVLRSGPDGRRRLLRVDNVDGPAQAAAAAGLAAQLRGCAQVFTARAHGWTGPGWVRVPAPPLPAPEAVELLREKVREIDPQWVPDAAPAARIARELGHLPLALHIAASHLASGIAAEAYIDRFRAQKLALDHVHPDGGSTEAEQARRNVRSSFEISWTLWCAGEGADAALQAGLVALAQSRIDSLGDDLGAALAALSPADYGRLLVGARRLALVELEAVRDREDVAPRRRLRLHALMAEFLRDKQGPEATVVQARLTGWLLPKIADQNNGSMRSSRAAVVCEPAALRQWLTSADLEAGLAELVSITRFADACGPYSAWFSCFERWSDVCRDTRLKAQLYWAMTHMALQESDSEKALLMARSAEEIFASVGALGSLATIHSLIADIMRLRGELDEAMRILREKVLPFFEQNGVMRESAVTHGKIADILQLRGDMEEALRIRRQEEIPVYELLGDVRERAVAQGKIADILVVRGEWDEAIRIRREEQIPVYVRLGEVREHAITQGQIADILQARGELEEALRIHREEVLPVFERLGDLRSLLVERANLAFTLSRRGHHEDRPEIHTLLTQALADAERLRLPEAQTIRGLIAQIFGADAAPAAP